MSSAVRPSRGGRGRSRSTATRSSRRTKARGAAGSWEGILTSATSRDPGVRGRALQPGPRLLLAQPRPWRCQESFLGFCYSRLSPPFLCISPLLHSTPSVLRLSSLPLGLSASYSVSSLICVSDSNRCGPFSLCPRDLQWYPSLSVSDCLFFRRGSPETSLVVVGWGRGRTHTASTSISHCFCYLLETQPLSCPLPGRRESS